MADFDIKKQIVHVFTAWGKTLVRDTKRAINQSVKNTEGQKSDLSGSVDYKVESRGSEITFQLVMNDYWKFVNYGVNGTEKSWGSKFRFKGKNLNQKAMIKFLKSRKIKELKNAENEVVWSLDITAGRKKKIKNIKTKGIRQRFTKMSYEDRYKQGAFIVGRSIAKKGIEPTHFMEEVITPERTNELKTMLKPLIEKSYILEIKSALQ